MAPATKKVVKRTRLSLKEKFNLIQDHKNQMKIEDLSKKYKCGKTAVYDTLKMQKQIVDEYMATDNTDMKTKQQVRKFREIDEQTYNWLNQVLSKKLPVSGVMIQEKAKEFAENSNETEFKASNGWLEKFKLRHNLTFSNVHGESNDVPQQPVNDFLEKLLEMIMGYDPKDIANCDETGLFFRAIPKKTICKKGEKCYGGKQSKERLTVMLCCFADGTFEKPLVIGKSNNPRCFKNIKKENLPVIWKSNRKAWMTTSIMEEWLIRLNRKMAIQNRKILLFLDNATSHPNLNLSNIQLCFFPPNTTSRLQPLDQGIINAFKVHYRTRVVKRLLSKIETVASVSDLVRCINCLDAIYWIKEAIEKMPGTVVPNCFRKAGFQLEQHDDCNSDDENVPLKELRIILERIDICDISVEEFISFDENVLTEDDTCFTANTNPKTADDNDSDSEDDAADKAKMSHTEVLMQIDRIKSYACNEGLESLYQKLNECSNVVQDAVYAKHTKQSTIEDFFAKQK